jgi:Right handed beta helix region
VFYWWPPNFQLKKRRLQMNKFRFTIQILAVAIFMFAFAAVAQAQATRTWVSGVGDDVNPCSRTAPCKTYAGAISKTATNGEISTLDPGGFGAVSITKSITIEGTQGQGYGSILNSSVSGVTINFGFFAAGDTRKSVILRNLNIQGAATGLNAVNIPGSTAADTEVVIEDCVLDGQGGNPGRGITDSRTGTNATLVVRNTTIRNCVGTGMTIAGTTNTRVSVSGSLITGTSVGIAASGGPRIMVSNTVISANAAGGIQADSNTNVEVDHCTVTGNFGPAFIANGAGSIIRVSNTTAIFNTGLGSISAGGAVSSYGNNQTGGGAFPSAGTGQN